MSIFERLDNWTGTPNDLAHLADNPFGESEELRNDARMQEYLEGIACSDDYDYDTDEEDDVDMGEITTKKNDGDEQVESIGETEIPEDNGIFDFMVSWTDDSGQSWKLNVARKDVSWYSRYLAAEIWKESKDGDVDLGSTPEYIVQGVVQYLKTADYDVSWPKRRDDLPNLLEIYAFTERFAAEGLRKKTEAKFYYLARKRAKSEEFLPAIKKAFEIAAEGPTGQGLRNAAVRATAMNIKDVYKAHANFHQVMSNIPHFSSQLVWALSGADPRFTADPKMDNSTSCTKCGETWDYIPAQAMEKEMSLSCPSGCKAGEDYCRGLREMLDDEEWRITKKQQWRCDEEHVFEQELDDDAESDTEDEDMDTEEDSDDDEPRETKIKEKKIECLYCENWARKTGIVERVVKD